MAVKPALTQFNGGEISPQLEGRTDWDKYNYSAKLCKNFIPLVEGSLKRRGGTHFVALRKQLGQITLNIKILGTTEENPPTLKINGQICELKYVEMFPGNIPQFLSQGVIVDDGSSVNLEITCPGFEKYAEIFTASSNTASRTITLREIGEKDVTLTVVKFSDEAVLLLNSVERTTITVKDGQAINWVAVYEGVSGSGTIYIYEDETYYLVYNSGRLMMVPFNGDGLNIAAETSGTIYLPAGKWRIKAVGGGGGAYYTMRILNYPGASAAAVEAVFNLPTGIYEYANGGLGKNGRNWAGEYEESADPGGDTYLKLGDDYIVKTNGGGGAYFVNGDGFYGGKAGTYEIDETYLETEVFASNGINGDYNWNTGGSGKAGASVYGGPGWGSGNRTEDIESYQDGTNGILILTLEG